MISAIEWVPAGVADPNPKKYEFSAAELELIKMMEEQNIDGDGGGEIEEEVEETTMPTTVKLPKVENNLPADLRMDEYSSDEDENDAVTGTAIGNLLVEGDDDLEIEADIEEAKKMRDADKDDDESDSDDELDDVPDTREYTPLDIDGITSLGLSHVGTNAPTYMEMGEGNEDDLDDDSELEDIQIQADDALVVVAKTEDVSHFSSPWDLRMYAARLS